MYSSTFAMSNNTSSGEDFVPMLGLSAGAIAVPVLAFLTLVLDIPSWAWHIKNRNLPAYTLIFWVILGNIFNFINALIWPTDDMENWWHGQGLCDIESKFQLGAQLGLIGSLCCIMRGLARALDTNKTIVTRTRAQRQRHLAFELVVCIVPPLYMMLAHYIVQPTRYFIFAIAGCRSSLDLSLPTVFLIDLPPCIFIMVVAYYCILVIHRIHKYRKNFAAILSSTNSGLTKSRFLRLFVYALILLVAYLPVQFYVLWTRLRYGLYPYGWDRVHGPDWDYVALVPMAGNVEFDIWIQISLGFTVFFCFGIGQDAMATYRTWLLKCGFGHIFPSLRRDPKPPTGPLPNSSTVRSSFGSKAHFFFKHKLSLDSKFTNSTTAGSHSRSTPSPTEPKHNLPGIEEHVTSGGGGRSLTGPTTSTVSTLTEKHSVAKPLPPAPSFASTKIDNILRRFRASFATGTTAQAFSANRTPMVQPFVWRAAGPAQPVVHEKSYDADVV